MKLLLDECLPRKLKFFFSERGHHCTTVREAGFGSKENGELLALAEGNYDVLVTIDKNIRHQQNMTGRHIANPSESERTGVVDANQHYRRLFSIEHNVSQADLWPAWLFSSTSGLPVIER